MRGSDVPGQFTQLPCQRQGTMDALAAPGLESGIAFVISVTTASHGNGSCEMTGIALISVQQLLKILGKHILFWEHHVWVSKTKF